MVEEGEEGVLSVAEESEEQNKEEEEPNKEEFFKVSDRLEALILKELLHSITNKKKTKHFPPLLQLRLDAFEYFYAFTKVATGQLNSELSHL